MAKVVSYKENTDKRGLEQDVSIQDFDFQKLAGMLDVTDVELSDLFSLKTARGNKLIFVLNILYKL